MIAIAIDFVDDLTTLQYSSKTNKILKLKLYYPTSYIFSNFKSNRLERILTMNLYLSYILHYIKNVFYLIRLKLYNQ